MIIHKITMENFKGFDFKTIEGLGEHVIIEGDNGLGKTSIGDAICFALLGCLSNGSNKHAMIVKQGAKQAAVEIHFSLENGKTYRVKRIRKENKTEAYLNDNPFPASQEKINNLFYQGKRNELKKWFLSIFSANYFLALEDREKRDIITDLLESPSQEEVMSRMDEVSRKTLKDIVVGDIEYMLKNYREELKGLENQLVKMEGSMAELEKEAGKEIPAKMADPSSELNELKVKFKNQLERREMYQKLITERQKLLTEYQKIKNRLLDEPEKPDIRSGKCPTCGQPVQAHNAQIILAQWKRQCEEVKAKNHQVKLALNQIALKGRALTEEIKRIQESTNFEEFKRIEGEIHNMENKVKIVLQHNAKVDALALAVVKAKERLEELKQEYENKKKGVIRYKLLIQALELYRKTEAEILSEQITSKLKDVSIQLYEIVKSTGELKQTFKLTYRGKDLGMCSLSERIRAHLEIAGALNEITRAAIPVYLDNAESITQWDWPAATSQVFDVRVRKDVPLTVTAGANKSQKIVV